MKTGLLPTSCVLSPSDRRLHGVSSRVSRANNRAEDGVPYAPLLQAQVIGRHPLPESLRTNSAVAPVTLPACAGYHTRDPSRSTIMPQIPDSQEAQDVAVALDSRRCWTDPGNYGQFGPDLARCGPAFLHGARG